MLDPVYDHIDMGSALLYVLTCGEREHVGDDYCFHPDKIDFPIESRIVDEQRRPPSWCPLRKEGKDA